MLGASCQVAPPHGLEVRVVGNELRGPGSARLVIGGSAQYSWPFLDVCSCYMTTAMGDYVHRNAIFARYAELHINATRVFLDARTYAANPFHIAGGRSGELHWIADLVSSAAQHGVYTLLTWNDSSDEGASWPDRYRAAFDMFTDVVHTLGGGNPWVIYEPWNEPHDVTWSQWLGPVKAAISAFRGLGYRGPLFIDTIDWSWSFNPAVARSVMQADDTANGQAQIVFANHRYANGHSCFTCGKPVITGRSDTDADVWETEVGQYAAAFPIAGTEYGYYDYGANDPGPDPGWNAELLAYLADTKLEQGFNGYWDFVWDWNDANSMTTYPTDYVTLSQHGASSSALYYSVYQQRAGVPSSTPSGTPAS
ncbi:MAG: cellulase family glycosylhydrolase [Candidatus Dormibacteraeota bacterium]|nr:cellulase family glycosylhydrolase [Candidatus Dormibacteraeota bacterium]